MISLTIPYANCIDFRSIIFEKLKTNLVTVYHSDCLLLKFRLYSNMQCDLTKTALVYANPISEPLNN